MQVGKKIELNSIACNSLRPWQFAVGGGDEYVRIYDQRRTDSGGATSSLGRQSANMALPVCLSSFIPPAFGNLPLQLLSYPKPCFFISSPPGILHINYPFILSPAQDILRSPEFPTVMVIDPGDPASRFSTSANLSKPCALDITSGGSSIDLRTPCEGIVRLWPHRGEVACAHLTSS